MRPLLRALRLVGHATHARDLSVCRAHLLASVSKDGTVRRATPELRTCDGLTSRANSQVRVWNVKTETCVASLSSPQATTAVFRVRHLPLRTGVLLLLSSSGRRRTGLPCLWEQAAERYSSGSCLRRCELRTQPCTDRT